GTRRLAAASAISSRAELGATIRRLLDQVWPVLRSQRVPTGHNVVIYHPSTDRMLHVEAGVEVFSNFVPTETVRECETPAGRVATVVHWGAYDQMHAAYAALDEWCRAHDEPRWHLSWEVYGDWSDNPDEVRTDIFYLLG